MYRVEAVGTMVSAAHRRDMHGRSPCATKHVALEEDKLVDVEDWILKRAPLFTSGQRSAVERGPDGARPLAGSPEDDGNRHGHGGYGVALA
jgi:hypothetical protein